MTVSGLPTMTCSTSARTRSPSRAVSATVTGSTPVTVLLQLWRSMRSSAARSTPGPSVSAGAQRPDPGHAPRPAQRGGQPGEQRAHGVLVVPPGQPRPLQVGGDRAVGGEVCRADRRVCPVPPDPWPERALVSPPRTRAPGHDEDAHRGDRRRVDQPGLAAGGVTTRPAPRRPRSRPPPGRRCALFTGRASMGGAKVGLHAGPARRRPRPSRRWSSARSCTGPGGTGPPSGRPNRT